jgi:hypothetical protein
VQGATLGPLIQLLRLEGLKLTGGNSLSEAVARARLATVQLAAVEAQSVQADGTHLHPRLVEQYKYRASGTRRAYTAWCENLLVQHPVRRARAPRKVLLHESPADTRAGPLRPAGRPYGDSRWRRMGRCGRCRHVLMHEGKSIRSVVVY